MKTAFVYTDKYFAYDYGFQHPLKIERLRLTYMLCKAYDLFRFSHTRVVETEAASESDLLRFHAADYLDALKRAGSGQITHAFEYGLGPGDNPVFPGMWEWSLLHTGASLQCARLVCEEGVSVAFNIAGGLHHAHAAQASGFCYVNDPVLAIYSLLDRGLRVMYLDVDAHHGDGVQWAFYDDPRVLTVSFHQDGRTLFPGTGGVEETGKGAAKGYAVNVPLLPGTDGDVFWEGFSAGVPRLMDRFAPDVVVSQLGVDTFLEDPLAGLELTTNGFFKVIRYLRDHAPAWVALGGGGYNLSNVARAWTLAWAEMNGDTPSDEIPEELARLLGSGGNKPRLRDSEHVSTRRDACRKHLEASVSYLERHVLPVLS